MMRGLFAATAITLAWLPAALPAQTAAGVPRAANGKPDLTGVWQGGSTRRGSWEEANSGLGVGGTGRDPAAPTSLASQQVVTEPAPYQPWAAAKVLDSYNKRGIDDPTARCLPPGLPRATIVGLFPIQIVQTPERIVIMYEYMNVFRMIPLSGKHPDNVTPTYMGDSAGRWEGDTLVVDVIGFNDQTWLTGIGTFHSEALHIVERYTRVDKDRIDYEAAIDDPTVLTRLWTVRTSMMLREGTRLQEYICAENNQAPAAFDKLLKDGVRFTRQ